MTYRKPKGRFFWLPLAKYIKHPHPSIDQKNRPFGYLWLPLVYFSEAPSKESSFDGALWEGWWGDYLVGDLEEPPTMSVFWMVVLVFFTWALSEPKR